MSLPTNATPVAYVGTANRARAIAFYSLVLGFALQQEEEYGAIFDMSGLRVYVTDTFDHTPGIYPILGWWVDDLHDTIDTLTAKGVKMMFYPGLPQDERGVWVSPDGLYQTAWFRDPDSNVLCIVQKG